MTKRIQIVARIEPELRRSVARIVKRQKTTLNAFIEAALRTQVDISGLDSASNTSPKASS